MKRRFFHQSLLAGLTFGAFFTAPKIGFSNKELPYPNRKKAKRLKKGDTIGLISPGSFVSDEGLEKAITNLESLGFKVKLSKHIRAQRGYTAGTDAQRLEDLHEMFADDTIQGIWCVRGGYGCGRLLAQIDYKLIKKNPKVLIGYSDITALLQAIYSRTGLVCFHGPVGASTFTDYTIEHLRNTLMTEDKGTYTIALAKSQQKNENTAYQTRVIRPGRATGRLIGGNLSILASLEGTEFGLNVKDRLLFIEDIGEKPYRIDRMLTQLRQSCDLSQAAGIILGVFEDCEAGEDDLSLSLQETLEDRLADLDIPILYGFSFGHISDQCTLPIGVKATLDTTEQTLTLEEGTVL